MRYLWLRLLAAYGPHDDPRHLIPLVIRHFLAGATPALTAGEQCWDYLYIEDAARALCQAALHSAADGVFVLGSGEAVPVRDIVKQIRDLIDPTLPAGLGALPYGPNQTMRLQADTTKLRAAVDWKPRIGLAEGLARTVAWHRALHETVL